MSIDITLIRHGETEANIGDVWQGQGDSPLTERGRDQASALGRRLAGRTFDRIVSSDLGRVLETSRLAGLDPEPMKGWREVHLGEWEGLSSVEVAERFPEQMAALGSGDSSVRLGGGESWPEFGARIQTAFDELVESLDDGSRVAIVAHGGVVHAVVAGILGFGDRRRPFPISTVFNTSITRIRIGDEGRREIRVFNDATHTPKTSVSWEPQGTVLGLVRHGESEGNVRGTWQGRTDGSLTDRGRLQAAELAGWYDGFSRLYSSPLRRARDTAAALGGAHGIEPAIAGDVVEMSFGEWEDLTSEQIVARDGDLFARAFDEDHPRGRTGETFVGVGARMRSAVETIATDHVGERVGVVSHGGAIRALAASLVGLDHLRRHHLVIPDNASVSHVRVEAGAMVLVDYNTPGG